METKQGRNESKPKTRMNYIKFNFFIAKCPLKLYTLGCIDFFKNMEIHSQ